MLRHLTALLAVLTILPLSTLAQAPTPVPRYVDEQKPHEWYAEQARVWQQETERDPTNAQAWFNYYRATRYSAFGDTNFNAERQRERVEQIADAMERAVPATYEYNLVRWWIGGNDRSLFPYLERALELRKNFAELAPDLISYYELAGDRDKVREYAHKWYQTRALSPALFEYTYNVLASLEPNAIIFTGGDLDTYPIWILQYARGIRQDVTVINTSLAMVPEYREWLMREFEIKGDASLLDWKNLEAKSVAECQGDFIRSVAMSTTDRPVYTALTLEPKQIEKLENNLYLVGLANRFSSTRLNNIAMLERNWRRFHLDYLDGNAYTEAYGFDQTWLPKMNLNYVAPALLLFEHCSTAYRTADAQMYRDLLLRLGREAGQESQLAAHLLTIEGSPVKPSSLQSPLDSLRVDESSAFGRSITLFPNPAARAVTVDFAEATDATLKIVGLDGSVIRETSASGTSVTIDLADVPSGSYLLKISSKDGATTKRLDVQR